MVCAHAVHDHGGMERAFAELIRHAAEAVDFVVVSSELQDDLRPLVTWRRVPTPASPAPLRFVLFWLLSGLRIRRARAQVVHTLGAITWARADLTTVQFCHAGFAAVADAGWEDRSAWPRRANRALMRALALGAERFSYSPRRVRLFAAVSPGVENELRTHYPGVPAVITPNGVDSARFRPDAEARALLRSEQGVAAGDLVGIFVGGDWPRKGLSVAIEAVAIARRSGLGGVRLWVVGEGDRGPLTALAERLGVAADVTFFGARADAERYLQAADVFVFPSAYEGASLVSHEAAATALPLVVTPVNGIPELVGADDAGLSVARTPAAVADALIRLDAAPSLRARLGGAARRRAQEYSWARSATAVQAAYARLLAGG